MHDFFLCIRLVMAKLSYIFATCLVSTVETGGKSDKARFIMAQASVFTPKTRKTRICPENAISDKRLPMPETIAIEDITSLGHSFIGILKSVSDAVRNGQTIHCISDNFVYGSCDDTEGYLKAISDIHNLYRRLISSRTKEALCIKKSNGAVLGRPFGSDIKMRVLKKNSRKIIKELNTGYKHSFICKKYGVSESTLKRFIKEYRENSGNNTQTTKTN